jgi:enoyl-[acyl-carrier-protein] reductase (NADH)
MPIRDVTTPDLRRLVSLFCASDLSPSMTGRTLLVDAGDVAR